MMVPDGRADLLDRKRRLLSDYLAAGQAMVRCLSDPDVLPMAEDLGPLLDRRDKVLGLIRRVDTKLANAPTKDPASEMVAENALGRALQASAELDEIVADSLTGWQVRLASALTEIGAGRKTLRGYRAPTTQDHRVVDEAA